MERQIVTITFFRFSGVDNQFWAFKMMQFAHKQIAREAHGLTFYKLLGSGGEDGFSWKPNLSVYGLLGVWDHISSAEMFFSKATIFLEYEQRSEESFTTFMSPLMCHGKWSGMEPFQAFDDGDRSGPVAVITRATIQTSKLLSFWKRVSGVSKTLERYPGRKFSIGIGEWPLIQQATFSIWDSHQQMMEYAYKNPFHKRVIQLTREKGWYKEELFARFRPTQMVGNWHGQGVGLTVSPMEATNTISTKNQ